jgi:hypothetical protein
MGGSPVIRSVGVLSAVALLAACGARSFDGWTPYHFPSTATNPRRIWAASPDDVWIAAADGWVHRMRDGEVRLDLGARAATAGVTGRVRPIIAGTGPTDIWVDAAIHFDGTAWNADRGLKNHSTDGTEMWGADPDHYFIVGERKLTIFNGAWTVEKTPAGVGSTAMGIHGSAADDVYVASRDLIVRFDGKTWTSTPPLSTGTRRITLGDLFVRSRDEIWAVGASSQGNNQAEAEVLRGDSNGHWARVQPPKSEYLRLVTHCGGSLFVANDKSVYAQERDGSWSEVFARPRPIGYGCEYPCGPIMDMFCATSTLMLLVTDPEPTALWIWH